MKDVDIIMNSDIRLIACDYDGTLSSEGEKVTKRTEAALHMVHENGCFLALVTGRSVSSLPPQVRTLPFDFIITVNGARVLETGSGECLSITPLSKEIIKEIFNIMQGKTVASNISLDGQYVFDFRSMKHFYSVKRRIFTQKLSRFVYFLLHTRLSCNIQRFAIRTKKPIEKVTCSFKTEADCQTTLEAIQALDAVEAVTTYGYDMEITAKGVSKGQALTDLCKDLAIDKDEVIAFGDSGNDLSLVDAVGCFLAPANASPKVLALADKVIPSAADEGVAAALEVLFNQVELEDASLSRVTPITE